MHTANCWRCGKNLSVNFFDEKKMYLCQGCKDEIQNEKDNYRRLKLDLTLAKIGGKLKRKYGDIKDYQKAFLAIKQREETRKCFDSENEILVALELVRANIKAEYQVKYGHYYVDFVLPDLKLILEIDSPLHRLKKINADAKRDRIIKEKLDFDWDIIRADGDRLAKDIKKLTPWLDAIVRARKKRIYDRYCQYK